MVMNLNQIDDDSWFSCHIHHQSKILIWNTNFMRVTSSIMVIFTVKGTNEASVRPHLFICWITLHQLIGDWEKIMMIYIDTHLNFLICKWSVFDKFPLKILKKYVKVFGRIWQGVAGLLKFWIEKLDPVLDYLSSNNTF